MPFSKAHNIIVPLDRTESRQNRHIIDTVTVKGSDRYRSSAVYARVTGDVLIASHATDAKRDETENSHEKFYVADEMQCEIISNSFSAQKI